MKEIQKYKPIMHRKENTNDNAQNYNNYNAHKREKNFKNMMYRIMSIGNIYLDINVYICIYLEREYSA